MSFQFNSDREQIRGINPTMVGQSALIFRGGSGADEKEVFRTTLDQNSKLPRIGINRTGSRVDLVRILTPGGGYIDNPSVEFSDPPAGGIKATGSAIINPDTGVVTGISVDNPGDGYDVAPSITISGGGGVGASAEALLDTIDFELDVNGAIRTSTSIISDTANIINLEVQTLATANIQHRAPSLKTFANGTGIPWQATTTLQKDSYVIYPPTGNGNVYQALNTGNTGSVAPTHLDGTVTNGGVQLKHVGFRTNDANAPFYQESGESGIFPRSVTPLLGDKSDKIATTEYVLNLATNDVGGRIYVSQQIGNDDNDGRSAVAPVRTIKKAAQLAWATPGVKESIIISGGEYREDNPISLPPDCSVVGDNLRLVIIRPENTGKHIFKFGDKNYVIGVTYQDKINPQGNSIGTWDFAMVFDDKQRITYDASVNGDFGTDFPIGHQFFGPQTYQQTFFANGGGDNLVSGTPIAGISTNVDGRVGTVSFDITDPADQNAFQTGLMEGLTQQGGNNFTTSEAFWYGGQGTVKWEPQTAYSVGDVVWAFSNVYEVAVNGAGTSGDVLPTHEFGDATNGTVTFTYLRQAYQFTGQNLRSTRAEGEVVFEDTDVESELPIVRVDFTKEGTFNDGFQSEFYGNSEDLGGVVLYTNELIGANNVHDYKEGEEIEIRGFPTSSPDLSWLNGRQRIYKVIEDVDGASRRIVLPKKVPVSLGFSNTDSWKPGDFGYSCLIKSVSKSVTFSLLNSPNKFLLAEPEERRYQDACLLIRNNIDFIADEVVGRINDEFKKEYFSIYNVDSNANTFKIYLGTSRFVHSWVSGGTVTFSGVDYNITDFVYDNVVTGEVTITTDNFIGAQEDDTVKLADILVQCTVDGEITQKVYPSFNIPVSDNKCRRDIGHFINAVIRDLEFGSNYNVIEAAKKYYDGTNSEIDFVNNEIIQTVRAIEYARELIIYAMRKWRTGNGTPVDPQYSPQYSTIPLYIDETVIDDTASPACANVANAIDTLTYLFVDVLSNDASGTYLDAAYLIARNRDHIADEAYLSTKQKYPSLGLNDIDERKCRRDINFILSGVLRDLILGGNYGSVEAAESYYTGTLLSGLPQSELGATRSAFTEVRDLSIQAMRNWKTASGSSVLPTYTPIPQFTDATILVDANGTPTAQLTPTNAIYDPSNGNFTMTFASAVTATTNDFIRIEPETFVFTCAMDGNKTEHYLPESDHLAATQLLSITAVTSNSITVNVGASGPNQSFTPTDATYDPSTGDFTITIGSHTLSAGEGIILTDNSFTFTCDMDGNDSEKTYPRPGIDPFSGKSLKIKTTTTNSITVNVGASGPNKYFTPGANTTYDASTGDLVIDAGQHGLGVGRSVVLEDNSFTFTCDQDGDTTQHTYPRPGQDPFAGKSIAITDVGFTSHTPTNVDYQVENGKVVFTLANHGWSTGDYIKIDDNAITLTCDLDGNTTQHTYPRSHDYGSGRWFDITVLTANTFSIEGLPIPRDQSNHTFVSFTNNGLKRQDGLFTINVGDAGTASGSVHTFVSATANAVKHEPQSVHTFVPGPENTNAVQHLPQSAHTFMRVTESNSVAVYPPGGNAPCADVEQSLTTSFALIDGILEFAADNDSPTAIQPGSTTRTTGTLFNTSGIISYPDNVIRDASGTTITIRARYDDYPIISASPYTQNASIISKEGGSGALIDGSKVKQPNCPFPGLNQDGKAINPNQGKSMVASAFTIVSEKNGIGYKIIEDGYVQLVSVFCIFTVDGILAESGGYASVTNSASNFGTYALRARGYRKDPYEFDAGTFDTNGNYVRAEIDVVAQAVNGNTELTIDNIDRVPLEHYIVKIDGLRTLDEDIEYFVDEIPDEGVLTEAAPYRVQLVISNGVAAKEAEFVDEVTGQPVAASSLAGRNIAFHRPSIVNSSSHTWEFVGSGTDYNALPENGGQKIDSNEQVSEAYGRVYASGTDELGDFKVGDFAKIENRTGNIQFTGTVSISEVNFLKLSSGSVIIRGFDPSPTLGGSNAANDILPTQKAVRDYITNNLGQYINKNYSTNPVPRALVELTDSGLISEDQLPAVSPFNVYTVDTLAERLALEGVRAGDIAIQDGTAYILNTDTYSLYLGINVDTNLQFTANAVFTGSVTGGKISLQEYRPGVVSRILVDEGGQGSGYTSAPNVVITDDGNTQSGHIPAEAQAVVVNGEVVAIELIESDNYIGGKGYTAAPVISFTGGGGSGASATAFIESRLYGPIVNSIKMTANDQIQSSNVPAETVDVVRVVNTSGELDSNWVSLSTTTVAASDITGGPIPTGLLASNSAAANSNTFLAGDQSYKNVVQSVRGVETRFFLQTALASGADTLTFEVTDQILNGYEVKNSVTGVQAGTTVTQVTTVEVGVETYTRITLSDALTSAIAAGTFIEFITPESPLRFNTNLTEAYFVESILVIDGGTGFAQDEGGTFTFNDVPILSGNGTGLVAKFVVDAGVVTSVTVVNGGTGYTNGDFDIDDIPTEIGTEGSGLILEAKVNTSNKNYGNVTVDIARAGGESSTSSDNDYGTVGVARFNKSQFIVGADGDGSVTIRTGQDSGLNADLLDGLDSGYFLDISKMEQGTLAPEFLAGTYNISISQSAGSAFSIEPKDGATTTDSDPDEIIDGMSLDVRQNSTNGLLDPNVLYNDNTTVGGTGYNSVLSIFGGSSGAYGGVTQLAFTVSNNIWVRGSSGSVSDTQSWSNWQKVWTSLNDFSRFQGEEPSDTRRIAGPDAYRLKGRIGSWYLNSNKALYGTLSDDRLPKTQTAKDFDSSVRVTYGTSGIPIDVYLLDVTQDLVNKITSQSPFSTESTLYFLTAGGQQTGSISKQSITVYNNDGTVANTASSTLDYTTLYAVIRGILLSGSYETTAQGTPVNIGTAGAGNSVAFTQVSISSSPLNPLGLSLGNIEVIKLAGSGGDARLTLGRGDGVATSPSIYFRSSQSVPSSITNFYNSRIVASGGNDSNGSGALDVEVATVDSFTLGGNIIWNAGNVEFTSSNGSSTYTTTGSQSDFDPLNPDANVSLRNIVMRDENGNFAANTITATLNGVATGNLSSGGGTLNGGLTIGNTNSDQDLTVYGPTTLNGNLSVLDSGTLLVGNNAFVADPTDGVGIGTTPDYKLDLYQRTNTSASATGTTLFRLTNDVRNLADPGAGDLQQQKTFIDFAFVDDDSNGTPQVRIGAEVGQNADASNRNLEGSGAFVVYTATGSSITANTITEKLRVSYNGNVGINNNNPLYKLDVVGNAKISTTLEVVDSISLGNTANNNNAPLYFNGGTVGLVDPSETDPNLKRYFNNFRLGNNIIADDVFEITATDGPAIEGGSAITTYKSVPALAIEGTNNRVAINTTLFGGTDSSGDDPIERLYTLNIEGDVNFNGNLFKDNEEFVTSRWTEPVKNGPIYRLSKVGINTEIDATTTYALSVGFRDAQTPANDRNGDINMTGQLYVNDQAQWVDKYGVIKVALNTIDENTSVPDNINANSIGEIFINNNAVVTIGDNSSWTII